MAAALLLCACGSGETPASLPPVPAALVQPQEYAWGDAVAARDERLARHVTDVLGKRYGHAIEAHYVADARRLGEIEHYYAEKLGTGWQTLPLGSVLGPGEKGFGFARGEAAVVVGWLAAQPDDRVPVTVFTFGEKDK